MDYKNLENQDRDVFLAMNKEKDRQINEIELIASENYVSLAVLEAMGSVLTNKYSEGYPGHRYYGGNQVIDEVETIAIERAKKLFNAEHVNVQPLSGSPANAAVYFAFLKPGDKVMGLKLDHGGHLSHGHPINFSGMLYNFVQYEVDSKTGKIDMEKVRKTALKEKPKMIVAGYSAYSREIEWKKFKEIANEIGAYTFADIAHTAGLIAAKKMDNPVPFFDVVSTTTHKTLRGPRGAIIMAKEKYSDAINRCVFPGIQGGPLEHVIAAKAVAFGEALKPEFKEYQKRIIENNKAMAKGLLENGIRLVTGGTDNHLILIDLQPKGLKGKEVETLLDKVNICTNKNMIPFDKASAFNPSGIRIGSPVITSRGFSKEDSKKVGVLIANIINNIYDEKVHADVKTEVSELCKKYPLYTQ